MRAMLLFSMTSLLAIGCGDDDGKMAGAIDASVDADTSQPDAKPVPPDANVDAMVPSTVQVVDCTKVTPVVKIQVDSGQYSPKDSVISVGEVARFELGTNHDAQSGDGAPDGKFYVGFTTTAGTPICLKFTEVGVWKFYGTRHAFKGTITAVQH